MVTGSEPAPAEGLFAGLSMANDECVNAPLAAEIAAEAKENGSVTGSGLPDRKEPEGTHSESEAPQGVPDLGLGGGDNPKGIAVPLITSAPATDRFLSLMSSSVPPTMIAPLELNKELEPKLELNQNLKVRDDNGTSAVSQRPAAATKRTSIDTDEAFGHSPSPTKRSHPASIGVILEPVPNSDVALRLLRKFASKTRPLIPIKQGGTKSLGILGFFFGSPQVDNVTLAPFQELMSIVMDGADVTDEGEHKTDADVVVESILGGSGDSAEKARLAMASFCHVFSVWCHASPRGDGKDKSGPVLLAIAMDTTTALVAHGCLDKVALRISGQKFQLIYTLAESIFVADLSQERTELAALKFLLTAGCRSTPDGEALIRGTHLLQSIRVIYHVYLTTESESNKTTAKASLQQLVTSVFKRMLVVTPDTPSVEGFPSSSHRDSFLVLRSLCKLSMRSLPDPNAMTGHLGLQTSGSNIMWDGGVKKEPGSPITMATRNGEADRIFTKVHDPPTTLSTHAIHPALESKILALELLLYVLQNTDMSGSFLQNSGPQFQYGIRNYLCVSLLKNCTSGNTTVVNLSLRLFVPLIRNFRSHLKTEIEAFVTNVFFVILDSKHSATEHKALVVTLFEEICSDPQTLAEIFLNYDCDLSAVDLFHRIVNTLARVAKTGIHDESQVSSMGFVAGVGAARMEKIRYDNRSLRLSSMRTLRQVLASLHASIVEPLPKVETSPLSTQINNSSTESVMSPDIEKQSLVQMYDSKKKRRAEESEVILRFNRKPSDGLKYASKCGHVDGDDPADVARYLFKNKDAFDKTQIGEVLGREVAYQGGFSIKVLHEYAIMMDYTGLLFDDAIRYYLSGFRLPGEAQKIDRIMEKFAERYTSQNPHVFPSADVAFILAFSIIMLNTDLHNPSIKDDRRMTKEGFIRNNRGIADGGDLPEELLTSIFDRIQASQISLKEDDEARESHGVSIPEGVKGSIQSALSPTVFFSSHYEDMDKTRVDNFQKERDQIVRTTESLLRRKRNGSKDEQGKSATKTSKAKTKNNIKFVRTEDTGLRDEYVSPMFDVTWGPALAAFSTAMESANGTVGTLLAIATDEELELAAENAAETIEVCLTGFRFAICTAGLCGNETARDAFMLALSRFTHLGTGDLLEPRHVRCVQTLLALGRDDGELLGNTWEHVFKALSEVHRFHELFQLMARNDRAAAAAAEKRRKRLEAMEQKRIDRKARTMAIETGESIEEGLGEDETSATESDDDLTDEGVFADEDYLFEEDMDRHEIDEANARIVYDAISESILEAIYQRSSSLSGPSIKEFIFQLCRVSRMQIAGYGGHVGSEANTIDLSSVHYRQQHTLRTNPDTSFYAQPDIFQLEKLVEVTHYNMDSRPRLVFSDIWTLIAGHLTSTALHSNVAVAMYAVDSFRQLSIQYLQREELGGFQFQRKFLKPLETVMARCQHDSIKELLLKCVERVILMFGSDITEDENGCLDSQSKPRGTLKSGWRPILTILGLAGRDRNVIIANMGFTMLTGQLRQCLSLDKDKGGGIKPRAGTMLSDRFVDLVDALLMYISGPHEDMSIVSIDHLVTLSTFLADDSFALPLVKTRMTHLQNTGKACEPPHQDAKANDELELWWPILLGLARSTGDPREQVRLKSLMTLLGIINQHFLPEVMTSDSSASNDGNLQTLQLIFRGVLTPVLEHAEIDARSGPMPPLPSDFERFITKPSAFPPKERNTTWLETTFEHFMDGCIAICMRSIEIYRDDSLIEEVFAMLNSCLLSDSGALAVRGLRRLQLFVTSDLGTQKTTDDTWATVCHMLRRCLSVRGLPPSFSRSSSMINAQENSSSSLVDQSDDISSASKARDDADHILEFVSEERLLSDRRYIGGNAAHVIGSLLTDVNHSVSMGIRWRLFLTTGLGRAVREWDDAAKLLRQYSTFASPEISPPNYFENAVYGRKWLNKLLLQLVLIDETQSKTSTNISSSLSVIREQTHSLVMVYLENDTSRTVSAEDGIPMRWNEKHIELLTVLVRDLIEGFNTIDTHAVLQLNDLLPIFSSCLHVSDEGICREMHKLIERISNEVPPNELPRA